MAPRDAEPALRHPEIVATSGARTAAGKSDNTLSASGLVVVLGGQPILNGIDLELRRGDFLAVLGPNGAGKSTLLRALAGVITPRSGSVCVMGQPLAAFRRRALARRLAYLPQETSSDFGLLVRDVVRLGRFPHIGLLGAMSEGDLDAVDDAMHRADVGHLALRRLTSLSGGERRRVFLARALAQGADALVLDEPTAALDVGHACAVIDFLRRVAGDGAAVVVSLHDVSLAVRGPTRAILLDRGAIVAEGLPASVLSSPAAERAFGVPLAVIDDPPGVVPGVPAPGDQTPHRPA